MVLSLAILIMVLELAGRAVVGEQGIQEWAEHTALRCANSHHLRHAFQ